MKSACAVVLFLGVCSVALAGSDGDDAQEIETSLRKKYASFDVDNALRSSRLVTNYIKCVLDQGVCTALGQDLKKSMPLLMKSACSTCDPQEKENSEKVIRHLVNKRPSDWDRFVKKFDPVGEYRPKYAYLLVKEEPSKPGKPTKG